MATKSSEKGKRVSVQGQKDQYEALRAVCWGTAWDALTSKQRKALMKLRDLAQVAMAIKEVGK